MRNEPLFENHAMAEKGRSGVYQNDRCTNLGLRTDRFEYTRLEASGAG